MTYVTAADWPHTHRHLLAWIPGGVYDADEALDFAEYVSDTFHAGELRTDVSWPALLDYWRRHR